MERIRPEAARSPDLFALVAGLLPALLWILYSVSNVLALDPPRIGPVTAINAMYVAMVPALVVLARRRCVPALPGLVVYAAFLAWVLIGLAWYNRDYGVEVPKQLIIYGLFALTAAQMIVGNGWAIRNYTVAVILTGVALSFWTMGYALSSGFAYRGGVPINPNLPAALIGAGLATAVSVYIHRQRSGTRAWLLAATLIQLYACLLLGSRGVLLGLLVAAVPLLLHVRPRLRDLRGLLVGGAAIVVLSLTPAVPYGAYQAVIAFGERVQDWASAEEAPAGAVAGTPARSGTSAHRRRAAEPALPKLDAKSAQSTAIGRFGEEEAASFNLRRDLWVAAAGYLKSGVVRFLAGGGMGTSRAIAHAANPVFRNMHNAVLQIWTDFGLIGLTLFGWLHWRLARALWESPGWRSTAGLVSLVFWVVVGFTATVTDMHVYWIALAAASASALQPISSQEPE